MPRIAPVSTSTTGPLPSMALEDAHPTNATTMASAPAFSHQVFTLIEIILVKR
jgi:hypothetical protein